MPAQPSNSSNTAASRNSIPGRCNRLRADGKRCADAVYPGHTSLCHYHLSQEMRGITDGERIAADILSTIGNFQSAAGIHIALSKLLIHQLTGRISRRDATALLYNLQLLLQTLPAVKAEIREEGFHKYWRQETRRILVNDSDLDKLTDPALLPDTVRPLHPADPPSPPVESSSPATNSSAPVSPPANYLAPNSIYRSSPSLSEPQTQQPPAGSTPIHACP